MMLPSASRLWLFAASVATIFSGVAADRKLISNSLSTCSDDSLFTASLFNVVFNPDDGSVNAKIVATSTIQGYVKFDVRIIAYGYEAIHKEIDPCELKLAGLCPMVAGKPPIDFRFDVDKGALGQIPSIAYSIPDLDATVRVVATVNNDTVACLEAQISNGKTVDLLGVKWATAIIAFLTLISSGILSGLGHYNAAAHVAANSLSLFGYFQAQAIIGLTGVKLPPMVRAWTQNLQWSMGVIKLDFMQDIFTWYQRATGGKAETILDTLTTVSVQVQKRGLESGFEGVKRSLTSIPRAYNSLARRGNVKTGSGSYIVFGIQRVAFRAGIESTNMFMTALTWFCVFGLLVSLAVAVFKWSLELCAKRSWMKPDRFSDFRQHWVTILKGILFRLTLLAFPLITVFCLWEFTQVDSPAEVILAVFFLLASIMTLAYGTWQVIRIARQSISMHRNPAYILFSDTQTLNKWGFLYIQFRASAYYFIGPLLIYIFIKSCLIAFAQKSGVGQAIGLIIVEAGALIGATVMRPWMDKSTNSFNIMICVVNFLNAIFLFIFTNVFDVHKLVVGIFGVILFVLNAAFSLVLLIMVIVTAGLAIWRKDPDTRYRVMADDRASFMKSQTRVNTTNQLNDLAAIARGDSKTRLDLEDDSQSGGMQEKFTFPAAPPSLGRNSATQSATSLGRHSMRRDDSPAGGARNSSA